MLFSRKRPEGHDGTSTATRLTIVRDVVEIVAIVAAGVWAFYTFVYENQIKPAQSKPNAQVESSLTRLGARNGLIAVDSRVTIRNAGVTDIWIYGFAETVVGKSVRPRTHTSVRVSAFNRSQSVLRSEWTESAKTPVYEFALLTRLADAKSPSNFNLRPGESAPFDRILYVAADRYDILETNVSLKYASRPIDQRFHFARDNGVVHIEPIDGPDADGLDAGVAALSLWRP